MMKARSLILALIVIAVLGALGLALRQARSSGTRKVAAAKAERREELVVTAAAKRQDLEIAVTQTGVVAAKNAKSVIPEISGRIQWICGNGIVIKAGDTLLRMDPTKNQEQLTDLTVRYEEALRRQTQSEVVGKARMKEMQLRLQRAQDDVAAFSRQQEVGLQQMSDSIAFHEKELARRREEVEVKRRLAGKGLIAGSEVAREEASLKAAEFSLQRERSEYQIKKAQAEADVLERRRTENDTTRSMSRTRSWSERDARMSGNQVENLKLQLDRAREDLGKTVVTAPVGGLVVLTPLGGRMGQSNLPRLGDGVSQGREIASIVSLERMQVKLELDQTQITGIEMGQAAEVTIDALPGKVLKGKISAIGQTARRPPVQGWMGSSSTATFPVTIDLPPTGKALIRPGMRANVRIVVRRVTGVITVPTGCVFRQGKQSVVYVERGGKFVQAPVEQGESNGDYIVIASGLRVGERIALNDLGASSSAEAQEQEQPKQ